MRICFSHLMAHLQNVCSERLIWSWIRFWSLRWHLWNKEERPASGKHQPDKTRLIISHVAVEMSSTAKRSSRSFSWSRKKVIPISEKSSIKADWWGKSWERVLNSSCRFKDVCPSAQVLPAGSSHCHRVRCGAGAPPVCAMCSESWTPAAWCEDWSWRCTRTSGRRSSGTWPVCRAGPVGRARSRTGGAPRRSGWPWCTWAAPWSAAWCGRCWSASTCRQTHRCCV